MHAVAQRQLEIEQQQAHEARQQQCQKFNLELGKARQKVRQTTIFYNSMNRTECEYACLAPASLTES
jgi:hypothetical protein